MACCLIKNRNNLHKTIWVGLIQSICLFSQVNGVNVVKVGHKQVVSLIRQGGNRLLMKVVSVTRKPESEEVIRKKGKEQIHLKRPFALLKSIF